MLSKLMVARLRRSVLSIIPWRQQWHENVVEWTQKEPDEFLCEIILVITYYTASLGHGYLSFETTAIQPQIAMPSSRK